jgi:hypothetical protein
MIGPILINKDSVVPSELDFSLGKHPNNKIFGVTFRRHEHFLLKRRLWYNQWTYSQNQRGLHTTKAWTKVVRQ